MSLTDVLIPKIRERLPGRAFEVGTPPSPCVTFPALHPDFGPIMIHDDGDELTLILGRFTHTHFSNFDDGMSEDRKFELITDDAVRFLVSVFADRIVAWGSLQTRGGWSQLNESEGARSQMCIPIGSANTSYDSRPFVWSGPHRARRPGGLLCRLRSLFRSRAT